MSTVVIVFPGAPKVDPAAAAREEAMKKSVARHVEGEGVICPPHPSPAAGQTAGGQLPSPTNTHRQTNTTGVVGVKAGVCCRKRC